MSLETIPRTEAYEFDRTLIDEPQRPQRVVSEELLIQLGRIAVQGSDEIVYQRSGKFLSSDDIEQLESFYAFLRSHYGIPNDRPVFPKKEPVQATSPDEESPEVQREA